MARKSSFLQGFEVGQDLYSRGVAQAQSSAQLRLQQDTADQRGKLLDMQLRESAARLTEQNRVRTKQAENRKTAARAWREFKDVIQVGKTVEQRTQKWFEHRSKYEPLIALHAETNNGYGIWKQAEILDTQTYKTIQAEKEDKRLESVAKLNWRQKQRLTNFETRATAKSITGKDYTEDADGTATAQSDIFAAQARGMYIKADEDVPENLDLDGDGRISAAEVDAAEGDVVKLGRVRETGAKDLEWKRKKELAELGFKGRKELATQKAELDNLAQLSQMHSLGNIAQQRGAVRSLAHNGEMGIPDIKIINPRLATEVGLERGRINAMIVNADTPAIDAIRLSGIYKKKMSESSFDKLDKAFAVRRQMTDLKGFMSKVNTGKAVSKFAELKKLWNSEQGRDIAILEGKLNAIIPNLARGVYGEVGVLTDSDIRTYKATFLSIESDEDVNKVLYEGTKLLVDRAIKRILNNNARNGTNVAGFAGYYQEITGESVSPNVMEMVSPYASSTGASGAPDMGQGAGQPSQPRMAPRASTAPGTNFPTVKAMQDAIIINAAASPPGTDFPGLTVGEPGKGQLQTTTVDYAAVRARMEPHKGKVHHDGTPVVHPLLIEQWEKEDAEKMEVTTPEATTPEAPAKPEAPEDEPAPTPEAPTEEPTTTPEPVETAPESGSVIRDTTGVAPFEENEVRGAFSVGIYKGKKGKIFRRTDDKYEFESGDSSWTLTRDEARQAWADGTR